MLRIVSIPSSGMDAGQLLGALGRRKFALIFDFTKESTYIYTDDESSALKLIRKAMPGFEAEAVEPIHIDRAEIFSVYKAPEEDRSVLSAMAAKLDGGIFGTFFVPCSEGDIGRSKSAIEGILNSQAVKSTKSSYSGLFGRRPDISMHMDLFDESEERKMLVSILEDVDSTLLSGRPLFNVAVALFDDDGTMREALDETTVLIGSLHGSFERMEHIFSQISSRKALAFGAKHAAGFVDVIGVKRLSYAIETFFGDITCTEPVRLGTYSKAGVLDTGKDISVPRSSLNLGTIISGLPGAGKTREAMAIVDDAVRTAPRPCIIVVSPTSEWNGFAAEHDMHIIKLGEDGTSLNFMSNPEGTKASKFYEDLAMLISSASNSGPYRNPMEKCLLNAFRSCMRGGVTGPTHIYDRIEESIIKFHGKRTNVGVKYTKHGENIRAALENLRQILSDWRYSSASGASFTELAEAGAVFDVSGVSNNARPYFYALLLTQFYAIADTLDDNGDNELRMLICIEEAQTIFCSDKESAASLDLINRIQDFRKKGVGMMLLAHSITDITLEIRRMCQNKLYMKQAPDVAMVAAKDLVFTYAEQEDVVAKLKHLDSRMAASNFVSKSGGEKLSHDSVFLRTCDYEPKTTASVDRPQAAARRHRNTGLIKVRIAIDDTRKAKNRKVALLSVSFLGENLCHTEIKDNECAFDGLPGRLYSLSLVSDEGRHMASCKITARASIKLKLDEHGATVSLPGSDGSTAGTKHLQK